jgi:hypothetical protein
MPDTLFIHRHTQHNTTLQVPLGFSSLRSRHEEEERKKVLILIVRVMLGLGFDQTLTS